MSFTDRMGIEIPEPKITIRNEAPVGLRLYLLQIMLRYANLKKIRSYVCWVTKEAEDPNNWAENDYMKSEVQTILEYCSWYRIYDIIEYFYNMLENTKSEFEKDINEYFIEKGIGWKLCNGIIETRGDKAFEQKIAEVIDVLGDVGLETSQNEIREALKDMSKRPEPDITGSVQHSVASLECLCREITGDKKLTLGTLIKQNSEIVPKPLDNVIKEVFGFASEHGRHVREGDIPTYEDAELIVHLCASLCCYLSKKNFERNEFKDWL